MQIKSIFAIAEWLLTSQIINLVKQLTWHSRRSSQGVNDKRNSFHFTVTISKTEKFIASTSANCYPQ